MVIHPQVFTTPDCPVVQFRESRSQIDLDQEIKRVVNREKWGVGTYFHVQLMDHERKTLLASALFVITEEMEQNVVNEDNPYQPMTKTVQMRKAAQIGQWWDSKSPDVRNPEKATPKRKTA